MNLGTFSVRLAVKNLEKSRKFYEKLGFKIFAGDAAQNWLILKNGDHAIGLFQGMFDKNILTFNPGWDSNAQKIDNFTDVRDLQRQLTPCLISWSAFRIFSARRVALLSRQNPPVPT